VTRYLPPVFQTWAMFMLHDPNYTTEACKKTAFFQLIYYSSITAAAQIVLTQRTYAITGKNKWIAGVLYGIFTLQLGVAIYMLVWSVMGPITQFPSIPLDAYRICIIRTSRALTVLQMSISLSFDVAVFVLIIIQTRLIRSRYQGMGGPDVLNTLNRDAEIYFAVIATSHFVIVIMFGVARAGIGPIPIVGNAVYIPMMISRMIMSLKKAASSQQTHMGMDAPNAFPMNSRDSYRPNRVESIRFSTIK